MAEKENSKVGRPEGGNSTENVKLNLSKPICVNPDYVKPRIRVKEPDNEPRKYRCCMCGNEYNTQRGNFVSAGKSFLWKGNGGYLPFCKSCCEILMETYTSFYSGNEEHALKHLCMMFDWYYDIRASDMTLRQVHTGKSRLTMYPSKACTRQVALDGETYMDTIRHDCNEQATIIDVSPVDSEDNEEEFVVTKEMLQIWGKGFKSDEYAFLEKEYADWLSKNICNTKTQEELFRNIVLAQLDIRRARERGGKVSEAQDALQKLMGSANILPRQTTENILADTQTFGTLLEKYEKTRPIPEPAPEWRDVDGIRKYMNTWFRGGLGKALHFKNEHVALYDEATQEMERYTVRPSDDAQSADGLGAALFDVVSQGEDNSSEGAGHA